MKRTFILMFFLCGSKLLFAQIDLDIKGKKLSFFRSVETENKSELVNDATTYLDGEDVGQPLIYKRKQTNLPDLLVYYFPFKKDSTIDHIIYEWKDRQGGVRPFNQLKPYLLKYKGLLSQITARYGKSQAEGSLEDTSKIEKGELNRKDQWKNDTTDIEMYVTLSNENWERGNTSVTPTHIFRLYVRSPAKKEITPTLSKEKIGLLDSQARLFLADICAGKFDDSKKYIEPQVVGQVKNEQLAGLKEAIKNDKWDLNSTGVQMTSTGKSYSNLRYSRQGDTNEPPLEILSILFDTDDKIVAIQPLKR